MMELLHTILLRVTLAGIASAAALRIAGSGAMRECVRLGAGLLMLLALLQPLARAGPLSWNGITDGIGISPEEIEARNMQTTMSAVGASIAGSLEKYAAERGFTCTVIVNMGLDGDGLLQIADLTVYYSSRDANRVGELRTLLTEACGVPEERQELIER